MTFWRSCRQMSMDKYIVELLKIFTWKYGDLAYLILWHIAMFLLVFCHYKCLGITGQVV